MGRLLHPTWPLSLTAGLALAATLWLAQATPTPEPVRPSAVPMAAASCLRPSGPADEDIHQPQPPRRGLDSRHREPAAPAARDAGPISARTSYPLTSGGVRPQVPLAVARHVLFCTWLT